MTIRLTLQPVPFRKLPRQNELFLQYLEDSPRTAAFYSRPPRIESLKQAAQSDILNLDFPRSRMAGILRRQNAAWGNGDEALRRIAQLEESNGVAILTGQQVGLFTGPLYTVYKAMAALRLAEELRQLGIPAAAVFWMDAEDHDLAEATRIAALDGASRLHTRDCREALFGPGEEQHRPVGSIALPDGIGQVISEFVSWLAPSPWESEIGGLLQSTYRPGVSFAEAFAAVMSRLVGSKGLIMFNPRDPEAKRAMAPVFRHAILHDDPIRSALSERNRALESAGFPPQVTIQEQATALFLEERGTRRALIRQGHEYRLKNSDAVYHADELLAMAEEAPERFSPNVLLRPIVQDHLFPTVAYVGGPAEVAYFAQIQSLYMLFGRPMPVIWPRSSMTVLGGDIRSLIEAHDLSILDCAGERSDLIRRLSPTGTHNDSNSRLANLREETSRILGEIRPRITDIDPTFGPALDTASRKIFRNFARIQSRLARVGEKATRSDRLADLLLNNCYPNGKLQERELTVHQLIARAGPAILEEIYGALRVEEFMHWVVWVGKQGD